MTYRLKDQALENKLQELSGNFRERIQEQIEGFYEEWCFKNLSKAELEDLDVMFCFGEKVQLGYSKWTQKYKYNVWFKLGDFEEVK